MGRAPGVASSAARVWPPTALRERVLPRLRRAAPFDAAFWTTVDPVTLLFTAPHAKHRAVSTLAGGSGPPLDPERFGVPAEIRALAARLAGPAHAGGALPRLRTQTRAGRWATLHASHLPAAAGDAIAVIIDEPSPSELAPVLMMAYGLTRQEQTVTALVCRGMSTREIGEHLHISPHTVQDHLKSVFDKTGVRSRRELVAAILQEQYLPRVMTGRALSPSGFFDS